MAQKNPLLQSHLKSTFNSQFSSRPLSYKVGHILLYASESNRNHITRSGCKCVSIASTKVNEYVSVNHLQSGHGWPFLFGSLLHDSKVSVRFLTPITSAASKNQQDKSVRSVSDLRDRVADKWHLKRTVYNEGRKTFWSRILISRGIWGVLGLLTSSYSIKTKELPYIKGLFTRNSFKMHKQILLLNMLFRSNRVWDQNLSSVLLRRFTCLRHKTMKKMLGNNLFVSMFLTELLLKIVIEKFHNFWKTRSKT